MGDYHDYDDMYDELKYSFSLRWMRWKRFDALKTAVTKVEEVEEEAKALGQDEATTDKADAKALDLWAQHMECLHGLLVRLVAKQKQQPTQIAGRTTATPRTPTAEATAAAAAYVT